MMSSELQRGQIGVSGDRVFISACSSEKILLIFKGDDVHIRLLQDEPEEVTLLPKGTVMMLPMKLIKGTRFFQTKYSTRVLDQDFSVQYAPAEIADYSAQPILAPIRSIR